MKIWRLVFVMLAAFFLANPLQDSSNIQVRTNQHRLTKKDGIIIKILDI